MATDTAQILDVADKLGQLAAQHPAVARYRAAQKALAEDPEATRLMSDYNRALESLARQEQQGLPMTDAQVNQLQSIQERLASHLKFKALSMAQVEFVDLLRKINQSYQKHLGEAPGSAAPGRSVAPML